MLEEEFKFGLSAPFNPSSFLKVESAGVARVVELPALDLRANYYDTYDLRLARNGVTLRYRSGEGDGEEPGWTVKLPVGSQDGAAVREELFFSGAPGRIPPRVGDLVTVFVRAAPLRAVARLQTKRRRWSLRTAEDRELAELADDEVSIVENRRMVSRFRELEVERREGNRKEVERIARALRTMGATPAEPIPKAVRALGPGATAASDVPSPRNVAPGEPSAHAVAESVADALRRLTVNDPIARLGKDPEGVHQMRVAARRLRSDLRTFAPLVEEEWARGLTEELRWLADILGKVRDIDVQQEGIHSMSNDIEGSLEPFFATLSEQAVAARSQMEDALESDRYKQLVERLVEACSTPGVTGAADQPCRSALPPLVAQRWRKLRKRGRIIAAAASNEELHQVRIRAKRVRYAAEAVAPFLDSAISRKAGKLARKAEKVQDVLGLHQDAVMATEKVEAIAEAHPANGPFNLAAGRLVERQAEAAREARARFERAWNKLDDPKVTGWLKAYTKR